MSQDEECNPQSCKKISWEICEYHCISKLKCVACGQLYHPRYEEAKIRKERINVEEPLCVKCYQQYWICDMCNQQRSSIIRVTRIVDSVIVSLCSRCLDKNKNMVEEEQKYKQIPLSPIICKTCQQDITKQIVQLSICDVEGHHTMSFHFCLSCRLLWYDFNEQWFIMDEEDYQTCKKVVI